MEGPAAGRAVAAALAPNSFFPGSRAGGAVGRVLTAAAGRATVSQAGGGRGLAPVAPDTGLQSGHPGPLPQSSPKVDYRVGKLQIDL